MRGLHRRLQLEPKTGRVDTAASRWEQPTWPWTDEWINKVWSVQTMEYLLFSLKKGGNSDACYNMEES